MLWRPWLHRDLREMVSWNFIINFPVFSNILFWNLQLASWNLWHIFKSTFWECKLQEHFNLNMWLSSTYAVHHHQQQMILCRASSSDALCLICHHSWRITNNARKQQMSDFDVKETDDAHASTVPNSCSNKQQICVSLFAGVLMDCELWWLDFFFLRYDMSRPINLLPLDREVRGFKTLQNWCKITFTFWCWLHLIYIID